MSIRFNPSGKGDFEILPEGTFDFEIKKVVQNTNNNNNQQLVVDLEVADGDLAGRKHKEWIVLSVGWRLSQLFEAAGVPMVDTGEVDGEGKPIMDADENELVGKFVEADIEHRVYPPPPSPDSKTRANVKKFKKSKLGAPAGAVAASAPASAPAPATQPAGGAAPGAGAVAPRRPRPSPTQG